MKAKPCPFCGGTDLEYQPDKLVVFCNRCAAEGPFGGLKRGSNPREIAVKKWNHRASQWISVEDQQPACETAVLVVNKTWEKPVLIAFWDGEFWFTSDGVILYPTHWQPLPELPE